MKSAQKEGKLVVMGTPGGAPVRQAISEAFKKRYGISVEILEAGGGAIAERLLSERRAGVFTADIFIGGPSTMMGMLKPKGAFEPIERMPLLPEVINPQAWWRGKLEYLDPDRLIITFYAFQNVPWAVNTDLVKPAEEPKTWKELLEPKWKNKLGMGDPRVPGVPHTNFMLVAYYLHGLDYWRELTKQEPIIITDKRQQADWLANGKYLLLISPHSGTMTEFIETRAPVKWVMPEGKVAMSSDSGNIALVNRAPHPNAAKVFINWVLTREGQNILSRNTGHQSRRMDVPTDHIESMKIRRPEVEYISTDSEDFRLKGEEGMKAAREIFGG